MPACPANLACRGITALLLRALALLLVIGVNALPACVVFPGMDFGFMGERFKDLKPTGAQGICPGRWANPRETISKGLFGFMLLSHTASDVGYGAVIASLAGFALIRDAALNLPPGNQLKVPAQAGHQSRGMGCQACRDLAQVLTTWPHTARGSARHRQKNSMGACTVARHARKSALHRPPPTHETAMISASPVARPPHPLAARA